MGFCKLAWDSLGGRDELTEYKAVSEGKQLRKSSPEDLFSLQLFHATPGASHPERRMAFWEGHTSRTVREKADFLRQRCVTMFQQGDDPHGDSWKHRTHMGSGGRSSSMPL